MGYFQVYCAPVFISTCFLSLEVLNSTAQTNITIQLVFQCLQTILALLQIFFSCAKETKNGKYGVTIQTYCKPTNVILGVVFSVAHLVIMEANGDLQESNLKVWFLAYALM